jgi:uncharacterized membrane protein
MYMTFIYVVIAIILFTNLYGRVGALEKKLYRLSKSEQVGASPQQPIQPVQVSSGSVVAEEIPQTLVGPEHVQETAPNTEESLGRTLGIIGIFAVLFGIGFFLKYAFDNNIITITGRIVLGGVVGVLAVLLGSLMKGAYEKYGQIISGGGIAVLFVTIYTAQFFYDMISGPAAYVLFVAVTALSVVMSVLDRKVTLASIGVAGGFLAPFLINISSNTFDLIALLSYVLVINVGVAIIAYRYRWFVLQYISFVGTLMMVLHSYGVAVDRDFNLELFFFLSIYFAIFLATSVFHHIVRKEFSDQTDVFFVTVNAASYTALSYALLSPYIPDAMGLFTLGVSLVYFVLAYLSFTTHKGDRLLNITLPLIGAALFTIAIPMHFHGKWITVAWFIEALLLAIIDYVVMGKRLYTYSTIIFTMAFCKLLIFDAWVTVSSDFMPIVNGRFMLWMFAIACGLAIAYTISLAHKRENSLVNNVGDSSLKSLASFMGVVTQLMTLFLITTEIHFFYMTQTTGYELRSQEQLVVSIAWTLYATFLTLVGFMAHVRFARILGVVLFIVTAIKIFFDLWDLGELYRIVASIVFGVIALIASFLYVKYKDRIKSAL